MSQNRKRPANRSGQRSAQSGAPRTGQNIARRSRQRAADRQRRPAAYDQAQDARRTSQRTEGGGTGRTVEFSTAQRPAPRTRRPDNSIEFPQQARRQNTGSPQSRPRSQNSAQSVNRNRSRSGSPNPNRQAGAQRRAPNGRLRPTEANLHDPSRRERKKKRKLTRAAIRRRRIMRRLTAFALLLCVIAAGVYLTVTMLFKISAIEVQTADGTQVTEVGGYASEQILQALDVHLEENIFSFDPGKKSQELEKVFPMLEFIRVERDYPGTVVVRVTEAQPAYAMQVESGWLTLSASLKILAKDAAQPSGLPTLYGGEPVSDTPGDQLAFEAPAAESEPESGSSSDSAASSEAAQPVEDHRLDSLNELMEALDSYGMLADVTRIEFADTEQMAFLYQDRISVLLGTLNELDYKLKMAQYVLLNQDGKGCAATDTGLLDLSHLSASTTRKFRFAQGGPELPSGYIPPEPAPEEATEPTAEETPADANADQAAPAEDAAAQTDAAPADGAEQTAGDAAAQ